MATPKKVDPAMREAIPEKLRKAVEANARLRLLADAIWAELVDATVETPLKATEFGLAARYVRALGVVTGNLTAARGRKARRLTVAARATGS
jgi:hypothetical protein